MWDGNAHLSADEKALFKAAKETGDAAEVRRLLAAGVGVDTRDGHNMPADQTPLMLAARNGFLEIVRVLLDAGASVSAVDKRQGEIEGEHQPLHCAVMGQNRAVVEATLDAGADVNALTSGGDTPLNFAIRRGNLELMQLLVERGAAVVKFGRKRYQPPLLAVAGAEVPLSIKPALIDFLLKAGADPNATDHRGNTPLHRLAGGHDVDDPGRLASLAALLQAGARTCPTGTATPRCTPPWVTTMSPRRSSCSTPAAARTSTGWPPAARSSTSRSRTSPCAWRTALTAPGDPGVHRPLDLPRRPAQGRDGRG